MTAHLRLLAALTSGRPLSTDEATRLVAEHNAEHAHELAEQQRVHAHATWVVHPAETLGRQRLNRRKRGAALEVADLIDPGGSTRRKPSAPEPAPAPAPDCDSDSGSALISPAHRLAHEIERQPDVELLQCDGPDTLVVHVRPGDLDLWHWWCHHFSVEPGSETTRGEHVTAKGWRDGVRVLLAGLGVGPLLRSTTSSLSTTRLVPQQRDGGHERSTD